MGPKRTPTTRSAIGRGAKRAKSNHTSARSHSCQKQSKRHTTQLKQSCTSSSSQSGAALNPRIDDIHRRLSRLIEQAKEHMELGRRLSEEWVSCEAEVEDMEHLTTQVDDEHILSLRRQLDNVNTIMTGEFCVSDDSSDGF
ncbi:hypothetical protein LIER_24121 [Lithospermum erythrorhizon]|uniref:Uncharacterized protein n=1 Tax=Lithospermum erythrorhizon TaxID=34254 RepID=A0AAV3R017_LITER